MERFLRKKNFMIMFSWAYSELSCGDGVLMVELQSFRVMIAFIARFCIIFIIVKCRVKVILRCVLLLLAVNFLVNLSYDNFL